MIRLPLIVINKHEQILDILYKVIILGNSNLLELIIKGHLGVEDLKYWHLISTGGPKLGPIWLTPMTGACA